MAQPSLTDKLHQWLKGHQPSIDFCLCLLRVLHCWDDLIDKDKPLTDEQINRAMWSALIDLPANQFYAIHFHRLQPLLQTGILNWHSANRLEASAVYEHRVMAFVLRSMITDVIALCALILYGESWARTVHYDMQVSNEESLKDYLDTLPQEVR